MAKSTAKGKAVKRAGKKKPVTVAKARKAAPVKSKAAPKTKSVVAAAPAGSADILKSYKHSLLSAYLGKK